MAHLASLPVCAKHVWRKQDARLGNRSWGNRSKVSMNAFSFLHPASPAIQPMNGDVHGKLRRLDRCDGVEAKGRSLEARIPRRGVQRCVSIAEASPRRHRDKKVEVAAASAYSAEEDDTPLSPQEPAEPQTVPVANDLGSFLRALYGFSRPHTIYGTAVSVVSISLLAVRTSADLNPVMLAGVMQALIPALLMNIAIVGLNQLYDIEIDKVNKPYLPLASGALTPQMGEQIVAVSAMAAMLLGILSGSLPLQITLALSLALGVVYSVELPFLRWKRFPFLAAACIFVVRAVLVQLGFFLHQSVVVLGAAPVLTGPVVFATAFMCLCSVVIALFKDIPDVKGDTIAEVRTLSVRLGVDRVFNICRGLLAVAYGGALAVGVCSPSLISKVIVVGFHSVAVWVMWAQSQKVDKTSSKSLYEFYMLIWKLFYAEYLVIPFLR
mmetsp:Transcript_7505/g.15287  ORF Transcript_7505/g.15287 Transcript_7505/m.15287 type:complete len:438 (-) Transcript_7505:120-1433(-)